MIIKLPTPVGLWRERSSWRPNWKGMGATVEELARSKRKTIELIIKELMFTRSDRYNRVVTIVSAFTKGETRGSDVVGG